MSAKKVVRGSDLHIRTGTDLPNMILEKIGSGVDVDIEKPGLRPFRELLQNSDDAKSTTMTIRFDKDRMYLHNDGFTVDEEFVENISKIFSRNKKFDPDTSGNFGTGFRSAYMYTDGPELEWLCESGDELEYRVFELPLGMDGILDWKRIEQETGDSYKTFGRDLMPPIDGRSRLGVVFRFPWRAKNQWDQEPGWDEFTWNIEDIRKLAEDFREYAPTALLACRHLKKIRIIMAGAAKSEAEMWDFIVSRDKTLSEIREGISKSDLEDEINISFCTVNRPASFFDCKSGKWMRTTDVGHEWYNSEGLAEQVKECDGVITWSYSVYGSVYGGGLAGSVNKQLSRDLGFWDLALILLPRFPDSPRLPIFTPIPLAGRTRNHFGIIAMLPPEESRLHVDVSGSSQKEWLRQNITSVSRTYSESLVKHILSLRDTLSPAEFEQTALSCLPRDAPNTWFGVGGQLGVISRVDSSSTNSTEWKLVVDRALKSFADLDVVCIDNSLTKLSETVYYWVDENNISSRMGDILAMLNAPLLSENWNNLWNDVKTESSSLYFENGIDFWLFANDKSYNQKGSSSVKTTQVFSQLVKNNWKFALDEGVLESLSELILNGICENTLVKGWMENPTKLLQIPCIITEDENLVNISEIVDTIKLPELVHILPPTKLVKEQLRENYFEKINSIKEFRVSLQPTGRKILALIDEDVSRNPETHSDLESHDEVFKALSELLRIALDSEEDARGVLNHEELRDLRYIPCKQGGKISTMQNNQLMIDGNVETWGFGKLEFSTMTQQYHRDFIFKDLQNVPVNLPLPIQQRLRILQLHPEVTPDKVANALQLNGLGKGATKGNLIRSLIFQHGGNGIGELQDSLFRGNNLEDWLKEADLGLEDDYNIDDIKLQLLLCLLPPYGDEIPGGNGVNNASKIPMVLGSDGEWRTGDQYCISLDSSISHLFNELTAVDDRILSQLSDGILSQLGVQDTLTPNAALDVIQDQASVNNRESLNNLMLALLSGGELWSNSESATSAEAWGTLQETDWIPILSDELVNPTEVLFPSEENVELMGEGYQNFPQLDYWDDLREKCEISAKDLGMMMKPTDGMLVLAFCGGEETDGATPKIALKELTKRFTKHESVEYEDLDWGPHEGILEENFVIELINGKVLTNANDIWVVSSVNMAQKLKSTFPENYQVVTEGELLDIDKKGLMTLRKLGLLLEGPNLYSILSELSKINDDPIIVNQLWDFLLDVPTDIWYDLAFTSKNFPTISFCFDENSEVVILKSSIVQTSEQNKHGDTLLDGRIVYYPQESTKDWFDILKVPRLENISFSAILTGLNGKEMHPIDDCDWLEKIKAQLPNQGEDDTYLPVWVNEDTVKIVHINLEVDADFAINPGSVSVPIYDDFKSFPIIHLDEDDPLIYLNWINSLDMDGVIPLDQIRRLEPETHLVHYIANSGLDLAFSQCMEALSLCYSNDFKNPKQANFSSRMGRGGIPVRMTMEWDDESIERIVGKQTQAFLYVQSEDVVKAFIDEDDSVGNGGTCAVLLTEILFGNAPWFTEAKSRNKSTDGRFRKTVELLIKNLLETPTDEWLEIHQSLDREWKSHGRLFESNSAYEMRNKLTAMYGGCQICGAVTPISEYSDETKESLISIIKERGSPFYGKKDLSLPLGTQLWLCPRHKILWERKLIRFNFVEDSFETGRHLWGNYPIPQPNRDEGFKRMKKLKSQWHEDDKMETRVYDQTVDFTGTRTMEPAWRDMSLTVTEEHAKAIIDKIIDLLKD